MICKCDIKNIKNVEEEKMMHELGTSTSADMDNSIFSVSQIIKHSEMRLGQEVNYVGL